MASGAIGQFVDSWGAMGSLWGVNRSVARVHGLLIASDRAWSLDEIGDELSISKSNVSGCLKELRSWGVIRRTVRPGDRREFYASEPDVWKMLFSIMRERKKREFDATLASIRQSLAAASGKPKGVAVERLKRMEEMLSTFDRLADRLLGGEAQARALISFFMGKG